MQNKKTVLFIMPEENDGQAGSIKHELCKDVAFTAVILSEDTLRCLPKNYFFDKIFPKGSHRREVWRNFKEKTNARKKLFTYGEWYALPEKTFRNAVYRYMPDSIVVSSSAALYSTVYFVKKIGLHIRICVLCKDLVVDPDLIDENVDCYFVDNIAMRENLVAHGIPSERIEINTLPLSEEFITDRSKEAARHDLSYPADTRVIVVNAEYGGAKMRRAISLLLDSKKKGQKLIFLTGKDKPMNTFLTDKGATMYAEEDLGKLFTAADVVLTVPDPTVVSEVQAVGTQVIVFETEEVKTVSNYYYLTEELNVQGAKDGKETLAAVEKALSLCKTLGEKIELPEPLEQSAQMIALRLQQMIIKNETEEVL